MKDVVGSELNKGDYIVISKNISTAQQSIIFGYVTYAKVNRVYFIRQSNSYAWKKDRNDTIEYDEGYMTNNSAILKIPFEYVPDSIVNEINTYMENKQ